MAHGSAWRAIRLSIRIAMIVEGRTEHAFLPALRKFLERHLAAEMPKLQIIQQDGRIPTGPKLQRLVQTLFAGSHPADYVIALSDVYTGTGEFRDATDAISKMKSWVGNEPRFYPHVALHDFEAWLLPYWSKIQRLAKTQMPRPGGAPESINHGNPPSHRIIMAYRNGNVTKDYKKTVDAAKILDGEDLAIAANECPQFKALLNTIISVICGKPQLN